MKYSNNNKNNNGEPQFEELFSSLLPFVLQVFF